MIDEKSPFLHLPLPNAANALDEDVERLRQSLKLLDGNAAAQDERMDKQDSTQAAQAAALAAQGQTLAEHGTTLGEHTESLAIQAQSLAQQQNVLLGHGAEIDAVQQAILSVITGAGLAQDGANNAQLLAAIQQLISLKTALATVEKAGLVKPDGITIKIDADGKIIAVQQETIPVGSLLSLAYNPQTTPEGYLFCNGGTVSRTTYARLYGKIGTLYGAGDGSTTFNLPDYRGRFVEGADTAGTVKSSGLPDITGEIKSRLGVYSALWWMDGVNNGAFYATGVQATYRPEFSATYGTGDIAFAASRSNPIYSRSNTVQPASITARIYIKY